MSIVLGGWGRKIIKTMQMIVETWLGPATFQVLYTYLRPIFGVMIIMVEMIVVIHRQFAFEGTKLRFFHKILLSMK